MESPAKGARTGCLLFHTRLWAATKFARSARETRNRERILNEQPTKPKNYSDLVPLSVDHSGEVESVVERKIRTILGKIKE